MASLSAINITQNPLPYIDGLQSRLLDTITGVVIHCTETPDLMTARKMGEQRVYTGSGTGNSGHFYIDLNGAVEQYVPIDRVAHHVVGQNQETIGIELVNRGRWPDWLHTGSQQLNSAYPEEQIEALLQLLDYLHDDLPALHWIAGHDELDTRSVVSSDDADQLVQRKVDPGIRFPWNKVLTAISLQKEIPVKNTQK